MRQGWTSRLSDKPGTGWRNMDKQSNLDDIKNLREAFAERSRERDKMFPLKSLNEWLSEQRESETKSDWAVAFSAFPLPSFIEITACVSFSNDDSTASLNWERREGVVGIDAEQMRSRTKLEQGCVSIQCQKLKELRSAVTKVWTSGAANLRQECYDGMPVQFVILSGDETSTESHCNIADPGQEPVRVLARLLVALLP